VKRLNGLITSILITSGMAMSTHQFAVAQANQPHLAEIRINHDIAVENQRLEFIFLDLLRGTGLHGGFVETAACSDLAEGRLQIKQGATVQQAMDELVAANPGYQWELKDGVVNLMPLGGSQLLETNIAKFQSDATDRELEAALQDLLRLPEVREREASLGLKGGIHAGSRAEAVEERPLPRQPVLVHINLQNVSLQEAFNQVVVLSPDGVWIYRETDCNGVKTYTVEMRSDY